MTHFLRTSVASAFALALALGLPSTAHASTVYFGSNGFGVNIGFGPHYGYRDWRVPYAPLYVPAPTYYVPAPYVPRLYAPSPYYAPAPSWRWQRW